jgi:hypothetical protein
MTVSDVFANITIEAGTSETQKTQKTQEVYNSATKWIKSLDAILFDRNAPIHLLQGDRQQSRPSGFHRRIREFFVHRHDRAESSQLMLAVGSTQAPGHLVKQVVNRAQSTECRSAGQGLRAHVSGLHSGPRYSDVQASAYE